ncbi:MULTISPECIES: DUF485 domain-containing protein [Streptomyces]|uniref:DUF485 domain-containing protein n=1 Tax=Streptomyces koelreuteriae TaxID=2838015 RepID=A0ABX8FNL1_9ACTN|nr:MULTISPECIES: DUF485 domain-containing protein [Streptomyces]QWB22632.1 DUF485 domain-containing protein [Streptomyces koelreuteriae]UUA05581.1 DUF485 domain-containing protein [Streptomyces koelreuteriae]UUA13208.1 DUF485 domain-containing protein [Streptomyces sp. CRCS-T-1]
MQPSKDRPRDSGAGQDSWVETLDAHDPDPVEQAGHLRYDDPWYDALASGWGESAGAGEPAPAVVPSARREGESGAAPAEVYLEVQRSAAFQEVRRRYRRFVVPAFAAFFAWYVGYVVAATTAPELMARPVAGAVNVAMAVGLGQFLTTFLLTWAYARHARLRRDRAALELRWDTQELTRGANGGVS